MRAEASFLPAEPLQQHSQRLTRQLALSGPRAYRESGTPSCGDVGNGPLAAGPAQAQLESLLGWSAVDATSKATGDQEGRTQQQQQQQQAAGKAQDQLCRRDELIGGLLLQLWGRNAQLSVNKASAELQRLPVAEKLERSVCALAANTHAHGSGNGDVSDKSEMSGMSDADSRSGADGGKGDLFANLEGYEAACAAVKQQFVCNAQSTGDCGILSAATNGGKIEPADAGSATVVLPLSFIEGAEISIHVV